MIRPVSVLDGYQLLARDGVVGEVRDFLFDDDCWQVRYLVVDTGRWLSSRRVLIATEAVHQAEWDSKRLPTMLSKEQVRQSPETDTGALSHQHEQQLRSYYGWTENGRGATREDSLRRGEAPRDPAVPDQHPEAVTPAVMPGAGADVEMAAAARGAEEAQEGPRLRSVRDIIGYHVQATDGAIGHIDDFLLDDGDWSVRFMVVSTSNWWGGRHVLISPQSIDHISWAESHVAVQLTREEVKAQPLYDPSRPEEMGDAAPRQESERG